MPTAYKTHGPFKSRNAILRTLVSPTITAEPVGRSHVNSYGRQDANRLPVIDTVVANRYAYAADNPINITEPTGQSLLGGLVSDSP